MNDYLFTKVRQTFERPKLTDIEQAVADQLSGDKFNIQPGAKIAIAAGSRGIANIAQIVKSVVDFVKAKGGEPFVIPAMGSHGGATAEGQREVLATYGIIEDAMGCPVRSSMEVVELDSSGLELPVFMDKFAYESDGVILVNRIKPHTSFQSDYESGLLKMSIIGLGKEPLASAVHSYGVHGLKNLMPLSGKRVLESGKILGGIGILENAYDETAMIEVLTWQEIIAGEPELLKKAKAMMPSLPTGDIDVLILDQIGKNISGSGMDPNIVGRMGIRDAPDLDYPVIKAIIVSDLTDVSHGNACGIGLADVTTKRFLDKIDWDKTYKNGVTSSFYDHVKLPVVAKTDAQALEWGIRTALNPKQPKKIIRIKDTLHVDEIYVSDAVLDEIKGKVEIIGEPIQLFDTKGGLLPF